MTPEAFLDQAHLDVVVLGDEALVKGHGELDVFVVERLRQCLDDAAAAAVVIVDLSEVTFVDCAVLRCLSEVAHDRAAAGQRLRVDNASGIVRRLMGIMRLDDLRAG